MCKYFYFAPECITSGKQQQKQLCRHSSIKSLGLSGENERKTLYLCILLCKYGYFETVCNTSTLFQLPATSYVFMVKTQNTKARYKQNWCDLETKKHN